MTRSVHIVNSTLRRRFVVVTVFALVTVIIAVLVTIDTLRAARSEHQLATALTTSPRVSFEPEVTLGGFPYVKYADRDEFPGLVITARGVTAPGPPDLKGVPLTCTTTVCRAELGVRADAVHAPAADRWHGGAPITLRGVHAYAKLDSVNLGRMLDITDLTVNTPAPKDRAGGGGPGDGLLELSKGVLLTGTVSLPPQRPSPRTNGRFGPSAQRFDGQRVKVTVTVDLSVVDGRFDLDLGQEVHHVFRAAVQLRVALLAAKALDLGDRDALHADLRERLADFVELEGFDDCCDEFHGGTRVLRSCT